MIIDALCMVDRDPRTNISVSPRNLKARLSEHMVGRALMCSLQAVFDGSKPGNARTLEVAKQSDGYFLPAACLNPLAYEGDVLELSQIKRDGFSALALFPNVQNWSWSSMAAERVVKDIAQLDLPIVAHAASPAEFTTACQMLGQAETPALLRYANRGGYSVATEVLEAARRFPQLIFDVGAMAQSGAIEHVADKIGADRLCVSSGAPLNFEAAAFFILAAARLDDPSRSSIETGTAASLLGLTADPASTPESSIFRKMKTTPKIDTHWHTGYWQLVEPRQGFSAIREDLDAFDIQFTCSSSIKALNWDIVEGNRETCELMAREPRVCGLIVVDPWNVETSLQQIDLYSQNPRFVGLKTIQDFYLDRAPLGLDHPSYSPVLEWANVQGWPVMAHLPGMYEAAKNHPNARFIAAHSTWNFEELATLDNVYFDIATSSSRRQDADFEGLVDAVGDDRVIFSSDSQLMSPAWTLGKLASSGLDWQVISKILSENAKRAFPRLGALVESRHDSSSD